MPTEFKMTGVPEPGDVLAGKYEVERVLGVGGMGVVLAAKHKALGQHVAIKMLLPDAPRRAHAESRFAREAQAAASLRSAHVARVTDFGTLENGAPYIVMEYLEGQDLKEVVRERGALPVATSVDYVLQACEALAEAHTKGIVHRDLKPANLFVTTQVDGSPLVKVLDFGISKASSESSAAPDLTATDAVMGSPMYMSPEQLHSTRDVDQRTDIWALGVVLFELLAAQPPFDGDNVAVVSARIVTAPPKSLHDTQPDVPAALDQAVLRCLEKDPDARYQSIFELVGALKPFASDEGKALAARIVRMSHADIALGPTLAVNPSVRPEGISQVAWGGTQWTSRPRVLATLGGVTVLALIVAGLLLARGSSQAQPVPPESAASTPATTASVVAAASAPPPASASAPVAAPSEPSAKPPPPDASAPPAQAPAAKPHAWKPPPKCKPGEVLSNGHCCARGLVWMGTRCSRPLATDVPF